MSARVRCMTEINLRESLEDFLIDNRELEALEQRLRGFNIFEAIGHVKAEERHSDFLAFLLDPLAPHGLGDDFITRFLQKALKSLPADRRPIQLIASSPTNSLVRAPSVDGSMPMYAPESSVSSPET